ncbi:1-phosphofructokinase [Calorimonas adulescens]|uniref:Tagatose-6-phosphate kinase n=1 Tax=Calorimonas adulescens TaxID=2606906 RepID=A0A5D8Q8M4_9THEO|nr:1-phosphofructokinase [Calorimonas adulescens]TZE80737.1 1-phosphofructokinase [Calorimonas adulescens]
MILTVTLNTSIDKAYIINSFEVGKVQRVEEVFATAGGKGLNVARVVKSLGEDVIATGFVGGYSGEFIKSELDKEGIKHDFVEVDGETRTCINIINKTTGVQTELLEPGPLLNMIYQEKFKDKYISLLDRCDVVTISGSMPKGISDNFYAELIKLAKDRDKKVILDTSGKYLKEGLKARPTVIKPNRYEAEDIYGKKIKDEKDIIALMKTFIGDGIEMAAITLGVEGGYVATKDDVYRYIPPEVKVKNAVGSGDAMTAGLAVGINKGYGEVETIRFAVAISAANAMTEATGLVYKKDVNDLLDDVIINKLE